MIQVNSIFKPKDEIHSRGNMHDYKQIHSFATYLRTIPGLRLFKIFTSYTLYYDINRLFNDLARDHSEDDLRELERLWNEFIKKDKDV